MNLNLLTNKAAFFLTALLALGLTEATAQYCEPEYST